MSRMKLGRKKYFILRQRDSYYDDEGTWQGGSTERLEIRASIHRGLYWNAVKFTDSGDNSKQSISIRSDQPLYQPSPEGTESAYKADIIEYDGSYWQVREVGKYDNIRALVHWEAVAVRMDESQLPRIT